CWYGIGKVMEQCVNRLDVAMFNAILRKSVDDIPTDPISNPISDSKVLPIPAGNSSVGLGAQLKNVER
ncbi:nucleolar-like protein, partial [Thalictrum thalictroides]